MKHMTLIEANKLVRDCDRLFRLAALAWERGNNSGNSELHAKGCARCDKLRSEAEVLLAPLGIEVDYPGLAPSFKVRGYCHYTTESAVSAALEPKKKST
jgi:hypothetical protein